MTDDTNRRAWEPILARLEQRRVASRAMGGAERVERHHARGKLDARQRIDALFDPGTFAELGAFTGAPENAADALVAGLGRIDGRPALAGVEDFTVLGGSIGTGAADKRYRLAQLARQERVPLVFMLEGAGHRLTNKASGRKPNDLQALAELSGIVPMVCLVLGPSAGHGALTAPLSDFVVMTPDSQLFSAGPPLVKDAIGEDVTKEELGGPQVHVDVSGVAHNLARDDADAIETARRYLSFFPANAWSAPPAVIDGPDTGPRRLDDLLDVIPPNARTPYPMRAVVERLVDAGSMLEVQPTFGAAVVTALARLGGRSVAIVANDPSVRAGTVDTAAAEKAAHFIDVAGAFHLPCILLADNPGVMAGTQAERAGALRAVARMFAAQHRLRSPKLHVTVRKAFGFGSSIMGMNPFDGQTISLSFPAITLGALPASSGAASAKLTAEEAAQIAEEQSAAAFRSASGMGYDDVLDPRDLRNALLHGLTLSENRARGPFRPVRHAGILP
ncbi:MAG: methylmalonyl-CoA decarboxylase subunit alpha [Actinomycetota bacterium]|nr:methylmalonyl-CoA decarboxylase subunit alpha [Actinomycetota bacterium]